MSPLNHKRTKSSLAPPIFYVAKILSIKIFMVHHSSKLHLYDKIAEYQTSTQSAGCFSITVKSWSTNFLVLSWSASYKKKIDSLFEPSPDFINSIKINIVKTRNKRKGYLDKIFIRNNLFGYSIMIIIMVQHYVIFSVHTWTRTTRKERWHTTIWQNRGQWIQHLHRVEGGVKFVSKFKIWGILRYGCGGGGS